MRAHFVGHRRVAAVTLGIVFSLFTSSSVLAETVGVVRGFVTSSDGKPIVNAVVTLDGNAGQRSNRTGKDGRFTIVNVPGGAYSIRIVALGYNPLAGHTIDVRPPETAGISLELVRSSSSLVTIGKVATRNGEALSTSSAPTQDLEARTAASRGISSVADMLAQDAISATIIHPAGGSPAAPVVVALRGPDPTETLVDIDGHSVNSGGTGAFDLSLLDPADLSSVQLVYGISPSSLVGPNTIGGAINVRTLEPTAQPHGLLRLSAGSFGSFAQTLEATGTERRLGYAFSLHRTTTQGDVHDERILADDGTTPSVGSSIDGSTALGKVRYAFGRGDSFVALTFRDQAQQRDLSAPLSSIVGTPAEADTPATADASATFNSFAGSSLAAHNAGYGLDLQLPLGATGPDGFAHTSLLFRHLTSVADQSVFGPAAGSSLYLYNDHDLLADDSLQVDRIFTKGTLSLKLSARNERLDTQQVIGGSAQQDQSLVQRPAFAEDAVRRVIADDGDAALTGLQPLSALGQSQRSAVLRYAFDPTARLHYTVAAYCSDFNSFGTSLDPRAGFVWTPTAQTALRLSAGSTFQSPQLPELYVPAALPPPDANGYIDIGNPNLKADHATDYDFGYEHIFGATQPTRVGIDLYRTNLRTPAQRFIPASNCLPSSGDLPVASCESFPINVGGAVYQGVELRAQRSLSRSATLRAAYSINSNYATGVSPQFQNGEIVAGEQFLGSPLHRGTLAFENNLANGLSYHAGITYEDGYNGLNRPAYATMQAGLTWHLPDGFDAGLYGTNLSNVYADGFTRSGAGVPYGGLNGPIATDAYALQGRAVTFIFTRHY